MYAVGSFVLPHTGYMPFHRYMAVAWAGDEVGGKVGIAGAMECCGGLMRVSGDHRRIPRF